jgi:hypothetical protein
MGDAPLPPGQRDERINRGRSKQMVGTVLDEALYGALAEFVGSDLARNLCKYCEVSPTEYGQIWGMFEDAGVTEQGILKIKLKRTFEQRSDKLLDLLAKQLRQLGPPHVRQIHYETGSPPSIRTIVIRA